MEASVLKIKRPALEAGLFIAICFAKKAESEIDQRSTSAGGDNIIANRAVEGISNQKLPDHVYCEKHSERNDYS